MRILIALILLSIVWFGSGYLGGYLASVCVEGKPTVENKPLTDWEKFYESLNEKGQQSVSIIVGVSGDENANKYELLLVDGDTWYLVGHALLRGCQPVNDVYYQVHTVELLNGVLKRQPSDKARFVVVGHGNLILREVKFCYKDKK